jgi:hypothetical protein
LLLDAAENGVVATHGKSSLANRRSVAGQTSYLLRFVLSPAETAFEHVAT